MDKFQHISIDQAKELISLGNVTIVDIRDPASYTAEHIDHAISVNDQNIGEFLTRVPKDKPLLCYCYHGFTSQNAADFFAQNGFKEVYSLEGGFEAWKERGV